MARDTKDQKHATDSAVRRIKLPKRRWYLPSTWRRNLPLPPRRKLSSVRSLLTSTFGLLRKDWRTFGGITVVYAIGVLIFVRSFSIGSDAVATVASVSGGVSAKLSESVTQMATLLADANASISAASSVYQIIISTICCLALIWAFRQILSHEKASVTQSFYQGMTPLVKYLLVLVMFGVQLIPVAVGGYLLSIIISSGAFFGWELWAAMVVFLMLALWSLRLVTHSIFALFITTLPDMTPLKALRSAKKMVYRRRMLIWRKLLGAVVVALLVAVVLLLPFVLWWSVAAPWMVYVLSVVGVPVGQAYLYTLYREIL